jgi:hypothetical protein
MRHLFHSLRQRRQLSRKSARPEQAGFATAEIIIGTVVTLFVITFWGVYVLLPELRVARDAEVNQSLRDNWSRTVAFISNEASHAFWIRNSLGNDTYPCSGSPPSEPLLVLDGPPDPDGSDQPMWRIVYGARPNNALTDTWRGYYRLVRCGPPFTAIAQGTTQAQAAAMASNLDLTANSEETVITDLLADRKTITPCPGNRPIPGSCWQPFDIKLYDVNSTRQRDRDAQLSLYLGRRSGAVYPSQTRFSGFHAHLRANRNPGFDTTGRQGCLTSSDSLGNQEPPSSPDCQSLILTDPTRRITTMKEFILPTTGDFIVNRLCQPSSQQANSQSCDAPRSTNTTDVIYLSGKFADFTVNQYSATDNSKPCSRKKCYLQSGRQTVTIYDGNVLVFLDRIVRL